LDHLAASHHVVPFAFDWRRPIEEEAERLADALDAELDARNGNGAVAPDRVSLNESVHQ